ncbi:hypothetical protein BG006_005869 [Podila minutissima]|uniref:Hemerythrin-like domain-containing protein n=1 Tax=Podila minutissima TaxID=64525 RepID=A0A9P5VLT5_9FUNG|nr:hypothetical protein BG006_005869 [Podila minutissima]
MTAINDDVILAVLARCDILTVVKCREVSKRFKRIIDKDLALENADFSILTFRQRRNITDSVMTPVFAHIFRRAAIVDLDGTGISHYGAMKLITDYTKELHIERCPRVDLGKLIQAIAGDRWLSYDLDPVRLYTKNREQRGYYELETIRKPLYEYTWAVVMMSNDCPCKYVKFEEYQPGGDAIPCHTCDKDVKSFTMDPPLYHDTFFKQSFHLTAVMIRVSEAIKRDHRELEEYYYNILSATSDDEKTRWQNQFTWELARHSVGEELIVYPAMEKHLPDGKAMADKDRKEHQKVKEQLYVFQNLKASDPKFQPTIEALWVDLSEHIKEEEEQDLVLLEKALEEADSEDLLQSFNRAKMFAPTRSHPSAPDKPPFENVVGLLAAPIDHLKDLFSKFPQQQHSRHA